MKWSKNKNKLHRQIERCFDELGFEWPQSPGEVALWDEKFKDFPYELTGKEIDPENILKKQKDKWKRSSKS